MKKFLAVFGSLVICSPLMAHGRKHHRYCVTSGPTTTITEKTPGDTAIGFEGVVRVADSRHYTIEAFDSYDALADSNHFFGVRLTYKLGKSYEERRIESLEQVVQALKSVAHHPTSKQSLLFDRK